MDNKHFIVCSYNVHGFCDAQGKENIGLVINLVKQIRPDVFCVQEVSDERDLAQLQAECEFDFSFAKGTSAILSKLPAELVQGGTKLSTRCLTVKLNIKEQSLFITCLHLDQRMEYTRIKEVENVTKNLVNIIKREEAQIWAGDFNSLTKEDYTEKEWKVLTKVRENNSWEDPKTEVSNKMNGLGFEDCWASNGKPKPLSTCRYDTHIDYIYLNSSARSVLKCETFQHIASDASDHKPVVATFSL
eukprot:GFUD01008607.1.p1 GENE.GFUD01008607.1~~GFUD01008607.1.p1  ORF type:complete len:245 (-),score=49.95 GFUD01008607.1:7-741(-)